MGGVRTLRYMKNRGTNDILPRESWFRRMADGTFHRRDYAQLRDSWSGSKRQSPNIRTARPKTTMFSWI